MITNPFWNVWVGTIWNYENLPLTLHTSNCKWTAEFPSTGSWFRLPTCTETITVRLPARRLHAKEVGESGLAENLWCLPAHVVMRQRLELLAILPLVGKQLWQSVTETIHKGHNHCRACREYGCQTSTTHSQVHVTLYWNYQMWVQLTDAWHTRTILLLTEKALRYEYRCIIGLLLINSQVLHRHTWHRPGLNNCTCKVKKLI